MRLNLPSLFADAIAYAAIILLALAALLCGGCEAAKPTDRTDAAIVRMQGAADRAATHVDRSLELNLQLQRGLTDLRDVQPEPR